MDKAQILQNLFLFQQQYIVDTDDFVVTLSGAMVLLQVGQTVEANAIDIVMPDSVYNKFLQQHSLEDVVLDCGVSCVVLEDLQLQIFKDAATYYCNTWVKSSGILCQHPYNTLQMKLRMDREKHEEHIRLLKIHLGL